MKKPSLMAESVAELLGTMVLILFGAGVVAQVVTGDGAAGDHDSIAWAWGIGVTMGVYVAARLSGAHLNPAVTIALWAFKGFEGRKIAPYVVAQTVGAFLAALIIRAVYADQIAKVDPNHTMATQGIFSTSPAQGVSIPSAFLDQVVGTALLVFVIFALTSMRNNPPLANIGPFIIGLVVVGIGMSLGSNAGYAINPARDFGPRLASWITGYGDAFLSTTGDNPVYFWLPIVAPVIGGLIGGALFTYLMERNLPDPDEATQEPEPVR
jgi:glycerol uptake facilitator protein